MSNKATPVRTGPPGQSLQQFNARKFAAERGVVSGSLRVADLPRARDAVIGPEAEVAYRVEGGTDGRGLPRLAIGLEGMVVLTCQRGLHPMDFILDGNTTVLLAASERELEAWDRDIEDAEVILADQPLDLSTVLEDELLLSLPFAPLCDDPGCVERAGIEARDTDGNRAAAARAETNPFGALRGKFGAKQSH